MKFVKAFLVSFVIVLISVALINRIAFFKNIAMPADASTGN
jgi:hypothetical protein